MTRDFPPTCPTCGVQLTIKHILTECRNQQKLREETLGSTHLFDILSPDSTAIFNVLNFLKKLIYII
jgi:hypothetical protein